MTKQKELILKIVEAACNHPTADDIFHIAKKTMPSIALGTVYRNLGIMVAQGEIRRIVSDKGPDRYDKIRPLHDHIVCVNCGEFSDISIGDLTHEINKKTGIEAEGYELTVKYVCKKCKITKRKDL